MPEPTTGPTRDAPAPELVETVTLEKRDAAGAVFERVELREHGPSVVTFRRPGEPPESYANDLPYEPEEENP